MTRYRKTVEFTLVLVKDKKGLWIIADRNLIRFIRKQVVNWNILQHVRWGKSKNCQYQLCSEVVSRFIWIVAKKWVLFIQWYCQKVWSCYPNHLFWGNHGDDHEKRWITPFRFSQIQFHSKKSTSSRENQNFIIKNLWIYSLMNSINFLQAAMKGLSKSLSHFLLVFSFTIFAKSVQ